MSTQEFINELLSLELYADTCAINLSSLKKRATGLRKQLEGNPSADLIPGLTVDAKSKVLSKRNKAIIRKKTA